MTTPAQSQHPRSEALPVFIGTMIFAVLIYVVMSAIQPMLLNNTFLPGFMDTLTGCMEGNSTFMAFWYAIDLSQTTFIASTPATIAMVIGGIIAWRLEVKGSPAAGTGVDGNGRVWGQMLICSAVGMALGLLVFGGMWPKFTGWIPTFACVLVIQPMIIHFGGSLAKSITITLLGTFVTFPVTYLIQTFLVNPMGVPIFVAVSMAIFILVPVLTAICNLMPWMKPEEKPAPAEGEEPEAKPEQSPAKFFINRVFGDIGELPVWGSSIAVIFMYIGTIIGWILNPFEPSYGAGNVPLLIASQIAVAALAIFIYYPKWRNEGWAFTFPGIVLVSAVVGGLAATGTPADIVIAIVCIVIGAIIFAPLVEGVMGMFHYKGGYHVISLIQLSIWPVVIIMAFVCKLVIIPAFA